MNGYTPYSMGMGGYMADQAALQQRIQQMEQATQPRQTVPMVFPAQAGVIPLELIRLISSSSIPRASGGDPTFLTYLGSPIAYSPRKRG